MEYLHLFKNKAEHNYFYNNNNKYKEPCLANTLDNSLVTGNRLYDYSKDYFTIDALGDGTITITIPSNLNSTYATSLSYSKDKSNF